MNYFISGGTGLIGRSFIEQHHEKHPDDQFTVLTRNKESAKNILPPYVTIIEDLAEVSFCDFDVILNLAGEPIVAKRWSDNQKQKLCNSRWTLTDQIVNKISKERSEDNPIRFISGSAVGIYGRQGNAVVTEQFTRYFPEFSHKLCQQWEDIAMHAKYANVALLRTGIVLSHRGGALDKMLLPFKLGLGGHIASGAQYMPWIHIEDMVAGIEFLIEHPVLSGPFNFTAPNPVTNKTFSKTLAKTLNRPCLFPVPEFVIRTLMGEMADLVLYGQNAVPQALLDAGFSFKYNELNEALDEVVNQN